MGKSREQQAAEGMANAHPIDRIFIMASGQLNRQNLSSIEVGDIEVTDPNGTITKIAGVVFHSKERDAQA